MPKYHLGEDGRPRICKAHQGPCPIGGDQEHFDGGLTDALEWAEHKNAQETGGNFNQAAVSKSKTVRGRAAIERDLYNAIEDREMLRKQFYNLRNKQKQGFEVPDAYFEQNKRKGIEATKQVELLQKELNHSEELRQQRRQRLQQNTANKNRGNNNQPDQSPVDPRSEEQKALAAKKLAEINARRAEKGLKPIEDPYVKKERKQRQERQKQVRENVERKVQEDMRKARQAYLNDKAGLSNEEYEEKVLDRQIRNTENKLVEMQARAEYGEDEDPRINTTTLNDRGEWVSKAQYEYDQAQYTLKQLQDKKKLIELRKKGNHGIADAYQRSLVRQDKNKFFDDQRERDRKLRDTWEYWDERSGLFFKGADDESDLNIDLSKEGIEEELKGTGIDTGKQSSPQNRGTKKESNSPEGTRTGSNSGDSSGGTPNPQGENKDKTEQGYQHKPVKYKDNDENPIDPETIKRKEQEAIEAQQKAEKAKERLAEDPDSEAAQKALENAEKNADKTAGQAAAAKSGDDVGAGLSSTSVAGIAVSF